MILCLWFWWCLILKISAPRFVCIGLVRFFCGGCLFWVFFHQLLCYLHVHSGSMCSLPALEGSQTLGRSAVLKKDCICGVQWNLMQRLSNSLPGCDVWPGSCWRQWQMCPGSKVTAVKQPGSFSREKQEENDIVPVWWMWRRQEVKLSRAVERRGANRHSTAWALREPELFAQISCSLVQG